MSFGTYPGLHAKACRRCPVRASRGSRSDGSLNRRMAAVQFPCTVPHRSILPQENRLSNTTLPGRQARLSLTSATAGIVVRGSPHGTGSTRLPAPWWRFRRKMQARDNSYKCIKFNKIYKFSYKFIKNNQLQMNPNPAARFRFGGNPCNF